MIWKRGIKIKQHDITDCAAACIASIASYYKLNLPIAKIRQYASTNTKGTNVLGAIEALQKLGFQAKGVRGEQKSLLKIPKPAIAHVVIKEYLHHFVVVYKVTNQSVTVMDPLVGTMDKYSHDEFKKIWSGVLILTIPDENFEKGNHKTSVINRFWHLLFPHRSMVIQALVGAIAYTLIGLTTSIYVQKIIDHVLPEGNLNLLNLMSVGMITLLVIQTFILVFKNILTLRSGQLIDARLILGYYKHLLKLPQQFFDSMRVGEVISRINDAVKIRIFINEALLNIAVNIFIVFFSFALMFTYYWKLALVILLVVPFYALIYYITDTYNKKVERKLMENSAELESQLVESLNAVSTIKSFGLEPFTNLRTEVRFITLLKTVYTSGLNNIFSTSSSELFSRLFTIILLWVGTGFVLDNSITPGELLSFYALIAYFTGPVSNLIGLNKIIQNAFIAADRLFEIMDLDREKEDNQVEISSGSTGDIRFRNVNFKYGSSVTVFKQLNLEIPRGKVTAIIGESGSGKSTLIALLQNLYPLQSGNISIGDYDLQYIKNDSLRGIIGVVPQKIDLFAGNVVDNIAVGDFQPDMKKIISICTDLGIMDFIEKLPSSFNTYLGENGATLSGGQKQRIAIARALYKEPEILILDEATSSLDSTSEEYVQNMIRLLKSQNKTIIIIAHRLSTVYRADKIVVLHKGAVVEEGKHEELMGCRSHYYELWRKQFPMLQELI